MNYGYQGYQNYNPNYNQNYRNFPTQMSGTNPDERIWVQGEGAAQAYLVAPNSFVRLWDSTKPVYYEKRADQTGRPYMETYEYKRLGNQEPEDRIRMLEERIARLERGGFNEQSNADDTAVQSVQTEF